MNRAEQLKHLTDEEIGCLIDGTMSKKERKKARAHLSNCDACLDTYTQTVAFLGEERKRESISFRDVFSRFPSFRRKTKQRGAQPVAPVFVTRGFRWALAMIVLFALMIPFLLKKHQDPVIHDAKVQYIAKTIIEENVKNNGELISFSGNSDEIIAAVRAGIFVEELLVMVETAGKENIVTELNNRLTGHLKKIFKDQTRQLFPELGHIDRGNIKKLIKHIGLQLEKRKLRRFFSFGRFIEAGILSTFEGKTPRQADIEFYMEMVKTYDFPVGILNRLKTIASAPDAASAREHLLEIKKVLR